MKKVSLAILAAAVVLAAVMIVLNVVPKDDVNAKTNELVAYNANLESILEQFQPKEELDKEVLATINDLPVSAAAIRYMTMALKAPSEGTMSEEEIKTEAESFFKENVALIEFAYNNGIELTENDIKAIEATIAGTKLQYGDNYEAVFADSPFTKFFYYFQTTVMQTLYSRVHDTLLEDKESALVKEAVEKTLAFFEEQDYVRAKHILIQFPKGDGEDGALTDEQKAATLAKANEVLEKVNAMADISEFDALIAEYNEDPGMQSNPGGYYFGKGAMVPEFEEAAYALEEGKTSGLVETTYGYHILLKLPLNDDALYNSEEFDQTYFDVLYGKISENMENLVVEYSDNYAEKEQEYMAEYEEIMARINAEAEAQAEAEAENNAQAESETGAETDAETETAEQVVE